MSIADEPCGRRGWRKRLAMVAAAAVAALCGAATPAFAIADLSGNPVPNTSSSGLTDQLVPGSRGTVRLLGSPFTAIPQRQPFGSPNSPEEDLAKSLTDLANAPDETAAEAARLRALAILEGGAVDGAAYSGIPLLNDATGAKVKAVPPGGNVVVNLVRFGEHQISDTWMLDFADPDQPFTIEYHVSELDGADGGDLTPTPLLHDGGTAIGGLHSIVAPLAVDETDLGTLQASRFTTARSLGAQAEHTRLATQTLTVRMPPPKNVSTILDPNLRPGHEALSVLRPAGAAITVTRDDLAELAPEWQIWNAIKAPFATLGDAHNAGSGNLPQVASMRVKSHLPPGIAPDPAADVTVAFLNNEVYVSRTSVRLAPDRPLTVTVRNADKFPHAVRGLALSDRDPVFGATDWGRFTWNALAGPTSVGPASYAPVSITSTTVTYTPSPTAFRLIVGDPDSGDQAQAAISLDRSPDQQSFRVPGPAFAGPLHEARDAQGDIWVTLSGVDKIGRLSPGATLAGSPFVEYHLPPPPAFSPFWAPTDIHVDAHGIVWATLSLGNAILRIDPAVAQSCDPVANPGCTPSTTQGIEIIPLQPCQPNECRRPFGPAETTVPVRLPTQMTVEQAADGLTEVWFTEMMADKIGVVKRLAGGQDVQSHFTCACQVGAVGAPDVMAGNPSGIDVDQAGDIWFAAANKNTIARLIPPPDPFASTVASIRHFKVPSGSTVTDPEIGGTFITATPHSVAVDPGGRVWFTELSQHKVGWVDPATAVPDTTQGVREIDIGKNDFGAFNQPADLVSDPAGTVYVSDEYGDQITAVTRCGVKDRWRPTERLSFTDQPLVDPQGNLWFLEVGANLVTRISGVAATAGAADSGAGCDGGNSSSGGGSSGTTSTGALPGATTGSSAVDPVTVACAKRQWAFGTAKRPRVLLLGNTPTQVTTCLGRPSSRKGSVWRYGSRIRVTFRSGRVTSFVLLNGSFRSAVGGIGVGSKALALRRLATARVTFNRRASTYRTILPVSKRTRAEVLYLVARGKVRRIAVRQIGAGR